MSTNKQQIQRITVKALIKKNDMVLLQKDHKDKWEMPGGKIQFGESPEEALRRELKEELDYNKVKIGGIVSTWTFVAETEEADYQFVVIVFSCNSDNKSNSVSEEHVDCQWIHLKDVEGLNMRDGYKNAIRNK